jgi:hypothetical protein
MSLDPQEVGAFVERYYGFWNDNDRQGWLEHWRSVAPGEPHMEDPVGAPIKRGWGMLEELWDRTGKDHFKVAVQKLFVCRDEAACSSFTEGIFRGKRFEIPSIDTFLFRGESLIVRCFWEIPMDLPYGVWTATTGEPVAG